MLSELTAVQAFESYHLARTLSKSFQWQLRDPLFEAEIPLAGPIEYWPRVTDGLTVTMVLANPEMCPRCNEARFVYCLRPGVAMCLECNHRRELE